MKRCLCSSSSSSSSSSSISSSSSSSSVVVGSRFLCHTQGSSATSKQVGSRGHHWPFGMTTPLPAPGRHPVPLAASPVGGATAASRRWQLHAMAEQGSFTPLAVPQPGTFLGAAGGCGCYWAGVHHRHPAGRRVLIAVDRQLLKVHRVQCALCHRRRRPGCCVRPGFNICASCEWEAVE